MVKKYYRASDIFINPSRSETQGLTYLEAMAAGVPVVCRADPCVERLIANGKNGFSCQSTAEMENAIRKLLSDPVLKKAVSDAASATVSASYTSDSFALAAEGLYSAVITRAGYRVTHTNTERNFSS